MTSRWLRCGVYLLTGIFGLLVLPAGLSSAEPAKTEEETKAEEKRKEREKRILDQRDGQPVETGFEPRKGPGEIWVGSPEVFTRERLVNDQLKQDAWLRGMLDKEKDETFGVEGIVDMRSLFGFSTQLGVEADPNVIGLYNAESDAALADIRRDQEQRQLQNEINTLNKLQEIRKLREGLASDPAQSTTPAGGGGSGSGDGGGGGNGDGDGGSDGDGGGGETPPREALEKPSTGVTFERGLDGRIKDRTAQLPSPKDPVESAADTSPLDEFRDRLAYREEIRNEIFENALDDRHDLRGNTAYRLNFDTTILPKKKVEGWAVVEVRVEKSKKPMPPAGRHEAERHCLEAIEREGPIASSVPERDALSGYLGPCLNALARAIIGARYEDAAVAQRELEEAKSGVDLVKTAAARVRASRALEDFGNALADEMWDESLRSWRQLPSWDLVMAILDGPCIEAKARVEAACASFWEESSSAQASDRWWDDRYRRWLNDFEREANILLVERWAAAAECLLKDGKVKDAEKDGEGVCPGDAHLGHEIAAYAQSQLGVEVLAYRTENQGLVSFPVPDIQKEKLGQISRVSAAPSSQADVAGLEALFGAVRIAATNSRPVEVAATVDDVEFTVRRTEPGVRRPEDATLISVQQGGWQRMRLPADGQERESYLVDLAHEVTDTFFLDKTTFPRLPDGTQMCVAVDESDCARRFDQVGIDPTIVSITARGGQGVDLTNGWVSMFSALSELSVGEARSFDVAGVEGLTVRRETRSEVDIVPPPRAVFQMSETPVEFQDLAEELEYVAGSEFLYGESSRASETVDVGETKLPLERRKETPRPGRSSRAKRAFQNAVQAVAADPRFGCRGREDRALGSLLARHLQWSLTTSQRLTKYFDLEIPGLADCEVEGLRAEPDASCDLSVCSGDESLGRLRTFRRAIEDREHVYAFAATPKETVQRISEVAARRSTVEAAAFLSALSGNAKIDSATELVLDSQRILHGIARKPLVVGFTHGLHSVTMDGPAPSPAAHAGWIIGPKFKVEDGVWTWPWNKGFSYQHVPIQNNLSVAISVPSWWEEADVEVTTYWRSLKNKQKGKPRRHRHRIELPGSTKGITDALLEHQYPEVFDSQPYVVYQGKPARLLLIGQNLWRSTRVTLGGQVADEIKVLPALAGLVATFKEVTEFPKEDGKTPREDVPVYVWTSVGKRLAGTATVHPKEPAKKTAPKIRIKPPYFVADKELTIELAEGEIGKAARLEMHVHPWTGRGGYGPPIVLSGDVKHTAKTKTYRIERANDGDDLKRLADGQVVRVSLVVTPEAEGKLQTITSENRGVFYKAPPKLAWNLDVDGVDSTLALTSPARTDLAFPAFDQKTGVAIELSGDPGNVKKISLKNTTWTFSGGQFKLISKLDIEWKDPSDPTTHVLTDKLRIRPRLVENELRSAIAPSPEDGKPLVGGKK